MGITNKSRRLLAIAAAARKPSMLGLPSSPSFHTLYSRTHDPTLSHSATYAHEPWHVLRVRNEARIANRDRSGLWVKITAPAKVTSKSVVRKWCVRRVRSEFERVLAEWGLDREGKPLVEGDGASREVSVETLQPRALKGSLVLLLKKHVLTAEKEDVGKDLERLVASLCKGHGLRKPDTTPDAAKDHALNRNLCSDVRKRM